MIWPHLLNGLLQWTTKPAKTDMKHLLATAIALTHMTTAAAAEWLEASFSTRIMEVGEVLASSSEEGWGGYHEYFFIMRVDERTQVFNDMEDYWVESGVYYCRVRYEDILGRTTSMCADRHDIYSIN